MMTRMKIYSKSHRYEPDQHLLSSTISSPLSNSPIFARPDFQAPIIPFSFPPSIQTTSQDQLIRIFHRLCFCLRGRWRRRWRDLGRLHSVYRGNGIQTVIEGRRGSRFRPRPRPRRRGRRRRRRRRSDPKGHHRDVVSHPFPLTRPELRDRFFLRQSLQDGSRSFDSRFIVVSLRILLSNLHLGSATVTTRPRLRGRGCNQGLHPPTATTTAQIQEVCLDVLLILGIDESVGRSQGLPLLRDRGVRCIRSVNGLGVEDR
jgi:hypothetical protein